MTFENKCNIIIGNVRVLLARGFGLLTSTSVSMIMCFDLFILVLEIKILFETFFQKHVNLWWLINLKY